MGTTCVLRDCLQNASAIRVSAAPGGPGTLPSCGLMGFAVFFTHTVPGRPEKNFTLRQLHLSAAPSEQGYATFHEGGRPVSERKCFGWETGLTLFLIRADREVSSWSRENPDVEKSEPLYTVGEDVK